MSLKTLQPFDDRIVVSVISPEDKTPGGIVLPDNAKEKPTIGKVLAVGPGRVLDSGERLAMSVRINDRVVFNKYGGTDIEIEGVEYKILRESDLLAKV